MPDQQNPYKQPWEVPSESPSPTAPEPPQQPNNPSGPDLQPQEGNKSPLFIISLFVSILVGMVIAAVLFLLSGWALEGLLQSIGEGNVLSGIFGIVFILSVIVASALLPTTIVLSIFRKKRRLLVINILIIVVLIIAFFSPGLS